MSEKYSFLFYSITMRFILLFPSESARHSTTTKFTRRCEERADCKRSGAAPCSASVNMLADYCNSPVYGFGSDAAISNAFHVIGPTIPSGFRELFL